MIVINALFCQLSLSGDHVVLSCGPGVKVVNYETDRVAWHLEEVKYSNYVLFDYQIMFVGRRYYNIFCSFTRWKGVALCVCAYICHVYICMCMCMHMHMSVWLCYTDALCMYVMYEYACRTLEYRYNAVVVYNNPYSFW